MAVFFFVNCLADRQVSKHYCIRNVPISRDRPTSHAGVIDNFAFRIDKISEVQFLEISTPGSLREFQSINLTSFLHEFCMIKKDIVVEH